MNRFRLTPLRYVLLGCIAVAVVGILFSTGTLARAGGILAPALGPPSNPGTPTYDGPLGIPAIPLRADLANSSGARFTETEVRQYLRPTGHPPR